MARGLPNTKLIEKVLILSHIPDSNVGCPNVVSISVLSSRRWANFSPTFIAVGDAFAKSRDHTYRLLKRPPDPSERPLDPDDRSTLSENLAKCNFIPSNSIDWVSSVRDRGWFRILSWCWWNFGPRPIRSTEFCQVTNQSYATHDSVSLETRS